MYHLEIKTSFIRFVKYLEYRIFHQTNSKEVNQLLSRFLLCNYTSSNHLRGLQCLVIALWLKCMKRMNCSMFPKLLNLFRLFQNFPRFKTLTKSILDQASIGKVQILLINTPADLSIILNECLSLFSIWNHYQK